MAHQTRSPQSILAADVGSSDASGELLRKELGERHVISLDANKNGHKGGYGAAVKAVLAHQARLRSGSLVAAGRLGALPDAAATPTAPDAAATPADAATPAGAAPIASATATPAASASDWIWLLQDDCAPAPDALEQLLNAVERSTTATVVGCKHLAWDNPRHLVDVGLTSNAWFDRFTLVNLDELDQGQYDHRSDFFAVNAAGMLVRADVWEQLGGFDPALPGPGDDVDFCARVRLAGHRVVVVPDAKMFQAVHRKNPLGAPAAARKAAVFTRLKHAPVWQVPVLVIGAVLSAVYWLFAGFLLKAPGHAVSMFIATLAGVLRPFALARSRAALALTRVQPRSAHRGLMVNREEAKHQLKTLREAVEPDDDAPEAVVPSILEPTGDTHREAVTPLVMGKSSPIVSGLALTVVLTVLSLITLARLFGDTALTGGALLPVSDALSDVWRHATSWWVSLGSGQPGHGSPFGLVLVLLSVLGLGNGSAAVQWLILLAVPLAGFTAWLASGAFSTKRWPRVVAALLWAGAPALQTALGQGRIGSLLAHLLIPLVVLGMVRATGGAVGGHPSSGQATGSGSVKLSRPGVGGTASWTAAAGAGLALAVVTAAAPSLFVLAVVAVLGATVFLGRRGKTLWWSLIPSVALYLPYALSARGNWRALLTDPGVPLASAPGPLWQQLLGFADTITPAPSLLGGSLATLPLLSWVAVFLIGGPVIVVAFLSLMAPLRRAGTVRALWIVALLALALVYAGKFVAVAVDQDVLVTPANGPAVSVAAFALLAAALLGFDAVHRQAFHAADRAPRIRGEGLAPEVPHTARVTAVVVSVLLVAAPLVSLGLWTANTLNGGTPGLTGASQLSSLSAGTIPATAADRGMGPEASRTIVLEVQPDASIEVRLMQGDGTVLDTLSGIALAAPLSGIPGQERVAEPDDATVLLRETVAALLAKTGLDPRPALMELGVGFVVLHTGDTAAELIANELKAVPGLDTVGPTESGWLWRVQPTYQNAATADVVNRVRIVAADGTALSPVPSDQDGVDTVVPAGEQGRRVVLAERADDGWTARLDGVELPASSQGWAQSFELPAAGGALEIRYIQPWSPVLKLAQVLLLALTVLLAIPLRTRRGRTGSFRSEAALLKVGRGA